MTRNWRLLTLAALLLLGSNVSAQEEEWYPVRHARPSQNASTLTGSEERLPGEPAPAKEFSVTYGRETAARLLMADLMAEFRRLFAQGDLQGAAMIAEFACRLQPECRAAQRARWLISVAKKSAAAKCDCGEKCCCANSSECQCGEKCNEKCACKAKEQIKVTISSFLAAVSHRIHVSMSGMEAYADYMAVEDDGNGGQARRLLLEGSVELVLNRENHPACILTDRAAINLEDGSYEVMPLHFSMPVVRPLKPSHQTPGTITPTSYVVPTTPMERGWR
jgi:hypothetical protein